MAQKSSVEKIGNEGSTPLLTILLLGVRVITKSRPLRIEYPDAWYHAMNRGRRGEEIYLTEKPAIDIGKFLFQRVHQRKVHAAG